MEGCHYKIYVPSFGISQDLLEVESTSPGWKKSNGHLIFDVNMAFRGKARWDNDGHYTPDTETSSYTGDVSRYIIFIALTTEALQVVDVLASDIGHACL